MIDLLGYIGMRALELLVLISVIATYLFTYQYGVSSGKREMITELQLRMAQDIEGGEDEDDRN